MILDTDRISSDGEYRDELRHRCETDHFFLAELMGFDKFIPIRHQPVKDLYFPKNKNLPIEAQHAKKFRMHLDPRHTFKTTMGLVDTMQWILAFPDIISIVNETATQPLAKSLTNAVASSLYKRDKFAPTVLQLLYPELITETWPDGEYVSPTRKRYFIEPTLGYTSPKTAQAGWHPWVINPDDMVDATNSGLQASDTSRNAIISIYHANKNTLRFGGYLNVRGTRYHPFDLYGDLLERMDPDEWEVLIRSSMEVKNGQRLLPGEFPEEDEVELFFPELLPYRKLRSLFFDNYESFMCFCAGSRVLMADGTEKPIEQMQVGDEVIGFEKVGNRDTRLVKTKVVRTFSRQADTVETKTDCGRKVRHTPDHRFLRPPDGRNLRYVKLRLKSKLVSVYRPSEKPTEDQQRDWDWLGGLLDGEGSISKTGITISQQEAANPEVFAKIKNVLSRLGIPFEIGMTHRSERFSLAGGRTLLLRLMQNCRMAKIDRFRKTLFGGRQIAETCGRGGGRSYPVVAEMNPLGKNTVYDIETETHNFVCEGFAVHNCQQQNDPQGGNIPTFDEKLYKTMQIPAERIPAIGDTFICWRLPYTGKDYMAKYAEGAAARVWEGKVYIVDAWQGTYTPSRLAEKIVRECRKHQTNTVMMEDLPGIQYIEAHIRNEAMRRNVSMKIQWLDFQEDDTQRIERMRNLEPQAEAGRVLISTGAGRAAELRRQFLNFGLVVENGIVDCVSRLAAKVPASLMRAEIDDEEKELQIQRRNDVMSQFVYGQQGGVDELETRQAQERAAQAAAMASIDNLGLTDILGGLDG